MAMGTGAAPWHPNVQPTLPPASTPAGSPCPRPVTVPRPWMPTLGLWADGGAYSTAACLACTLWPGHSRGWPGHPCLAGGFGGGGGGEVPWGRGSQ